MDIVAIIPARGGSKGVPQKNIRTLGGFPLIAYSVVAARLAKSITRVIVSTDSEEIAEIARHYGAEAPFLRPAAYARDKSPDIEFVVHALQWFRDHEAVEPDLLIHLRPTTPLRDPEIIDQAVQEVLSNTMATSLRSGHLASESPFKWFTRDDGGYFRTLNGLPVEAANLPRQDFPDVYIPDGYVDVLLPRFVLETNTMHGDKVIGYRSPVCTEVDTEEDFDYLEYQLQREGSVILDYLVANFRKER